MKKKNGTILTQRYLMGWKTKILNIKRYEIYFADLNPTIGSEIQKIRPVVIVSQDEMNKYLETIVICPLTSKLHPKWRTRLQIKCVKKNAEIAVDQIRAISKQRLKIKIDQLSDNKAAQLRKLITDMYGE
jgi:mRNA interferase MazF